MPRVLIADRDTISTSIYSSRFSSASFDVSTVESGEACVRKAQEYKPDAIVLELALPKMDGFQVIRSLKGRQETAKIPVFLLTEIAEQADIDRCEAYGCEGFFLKPFADPSVVVQRVSAMVQQSYGNL
ncbi:response regulator [Candidatus Uhrbacteria bacterium]|nr:response regulator [Candidatus Uhrbacteria bacterium]MBD3284336.1 response regulator [Candidatus Uhrbacteria bacterium]